MPRVISRARSFFLTWSLALLTSASFVSSARAGNDEGLLIGGQAALTAGAVTATVSDGSAAWYNPAGLAQVRRHSFDINASAYGISLYKVQNLFRLPDGTTADASVVDWQLVPTALSYTRVLSPRLVGSLGVMIPYTTDVDLRTAATQLDGARWLVGIDEVRNEYDYIASLGFRVSETLRWGVSLHGIYISSESLAQIGMGKAGVDRGPFQLTALHQTIGDYGLRVGLGLQWSPLPRLELGLALQTPTLTALRDSSIDRIGGSLSGAGLSSEYEADHESSLKAVWELSTPLVVRAGVALRVGPARLMLDGTVTSRLRSSLDDLDRKPSGNLRIAILSELTETLSYGAGLFTDLNSSRSLGANFFGVAGGLRLSNHYRLTEGQRKLTFSTTLAGRYAFGFGHFEGLAFVEDAQMSPIKARLRAHELAFNLGGAVAF